MLRTRATREPTPADKQIVSEFFSTIPLRERGGLVGSEMLGILSGRGDADPEPKRLPEYCYNIFAILRKTVFRAFPDLSEVVKVEDTKTLFQAKTIDETKEALRIDWRKVGRLFGVAARVLRYAELEATDSIKAECACAFPEKAIAAFAMIFGAEWVKKNGGWLSEKPGDVIATELLKQEISPQIDKIAAARVKLESIAVAWSPDAMAELYAGMAEGMTSYLTADGQLAGESPRLGLYIFLLLAWPEIKAMLDAKPRKTLRDLREWMEPFMCVGITAFLDISTLRDVCAPPPSGIGLSLRPLKRRNSAQSA